MNDIDSMDMMGFISIRAWAAQKRAAPKEITIDQAWPGLTADAF